MIDKHADLKKTFKHLYEYTTYVINDVEEPEFQKMTEVEEPINDEQPVVTNQNNTEQSQPVQQNTNPQPPSTQEPVQQNTNPQQVSPQPETNQTQPNNDFLYNRVIQDLNGLNISLSNLNTRFNDLTDKMDYLTDEVKQVKEPSNEEKLLAMTKTSYPFNKSIKDIWGNEFNQIEQSEDVINTPEGEIKRVGDEYIMDVNINDIPKPPMGNGKTFY